jgi:hypothetical protein
LRNIRALFMETAWSPWGWVVVPVSGTVVVVPEEPESDPDPLSSAESSP